MKEKRQVAAETKLKKGSPKRLGEKELREIQTLEVRRGLGEMGLSYVEIMELEEQIRAGVKTSSTTQG